MAWTLSAPQRHEIEPIKGSRFVALAVPVSAEGEAKDALAQRRVEMPDATHHCAAWRIAAPAIERALDDGEPSGSAGRPILAQLTGRELVDVIVVVTRYYGGTKLGVGGLVRAYGAAAAAVLEAANLVPRVAMVSVAVEHAYADGPSVERTLAALGIDPGEADFEAQVRRRLSVPCARRDEIDAALRDATAGRVGLRDATAR